jgi:hypothetical protein
MLSYSNAWNAWVRAINRPPTPSASGWDRVVGSPLKDFKAPHPLVSLFVFFIYLLLIY